MKGIGIIMENRTAERYDLASLIKQNDLNIHSVASASPYLTAGEYFGMLSELAGSASKFSDDLLKLISRDGDRNTYKDLTGMVALLKRMGYEKHASNFEGLLDAYDRGHSRLTSSYARRIIDDLDVLSTRITAARMTRASDMADADPYEIPLSEWIAPQSKKVDVNQKPVILAVDDSPVILKSVSSLLSDDYKVYLLAKSVMLEKTLSQITPDLFLLDYNMPIINGFELIPIIRKFSEHKDTPIIFLTSEGTIDNISGAVMLGACDFIVKPVQPKILRERIARHIAKETAILNAS